MVYKKKNNLIIHELLESKLNSKKWIFKLLDEN